MSGSGGFSGGGGGGGFGGLGSGGGGGRDLPNGGPTDDCATLVVETTLNSPVPAVVATLSEHDLLTVEIALTPKGASQLVAKDRAGNRAGSLTPPSLVQIINCIGKKYMFVAQVIEISGGSVRVRIRAK